MGVTLARFAEVGDELAREGSKLKKAEILGRFFLEIYADSDLRRAVWYLSGRAFGARDQRVLGVSGAAVKSSITDYAGITPQRWRELTISQGEVGEAMAVLWTERKLPAGRGIMLEDLEKSFDEIALHGETRRKRTSLISLFRRVASPREAAYLGKILFGDLRTGVAEGVLIDGVAKAFDAPTAELRKALLLEGDLGEVAVLARHKQLSEARFALMRPLSFMLAAVVSDATEAAEQIGTRRFVIEDKLDGIRAQVHKQGNRVAIYTRTLDEISESFPDVVAEMRKLEGDWLLDGEILPWKEGRALPFAHVQRRMGRKKVSAEIVQANPVAFIAFDLLYADSRPWLDEPLEVRRTRLAAVPGLLKMEGTVVEAGDALATQIQSTFDAARARRNEGVMLKDLSSPYLPGRRGQVWYKLKSHLPTLDCVVVAAEHGHGKRRDSLSDYTFAVRDIAESGDEEHLKIIGKAYSGVTDEEIAQLTKLFKELALSFDGRVYRVRPQVVLEIAFDAIQKSERHDGGFALRFPRIKRIRWDKSPADADTLKRVREIHDSTENLNRVDEDPRLSDSKANRPSPPKEPSLFDGL